MKGRVLAALLGLAAVGGGATYLSQSSVDSIQSHEGTLYKAYPDPATKGAPWTICTGHTKGVRKGDTATKEMCDLYFAADLWEAEQCVQRHVKAPLRAGQYGSYVSFVFNVGCGRFASSTMLRHANAGKWVASCNEFPKWKYAAGKVLPGIEARRKYEQATCLKPGAYVYVPATNH